MRLSLGQGAEQQTVEVQAKLKKDFEDERKRAKEEIERTHEEFSEKLK